MNKKIKKKIMSKKIKKKMMNKKTKKKMMNKKINEKVMNKKEKSNQEIHYKDDTDSININYRNHSNNR